MMKCNKYVYFREEIQIILHGFLSLKSQAKCHPFKEQFLGNPTNYSLWLSTFKTQSLIVVSSIIFYLLVVSSILIVHSIFLICLIVHTIPRTLIYFLAYGSSLFIGT